MATALSTLLPMIQPELPGAPPDLVNQEMGRAMHYFTRRSEALREELAAIDLVADQADYTLTITAVTGGSVHRILDVQINKVTQDTSIYALGDETTLTFDPAPTTADTGALVVSVAIRVPDTVTSFPAWWLARWKEAITHRTLAQMMLMPTKSWSNAELGLYHQSEYQTLEGEAKAENTSDYKIQGRVQLRSFA